MLVPKDNFLEFVIFRREGYVFSKSAFLVYMGDLLAIGNQFVIFFHSFGGAPCCCEPQGYIPKSGPVYYNFEILLKSIVTCYCLYKISLRKWKSTRNWEQRRYACRIDVSKNTSSSCNWLKSNLHVHWKKWTCLFNLNFLIFSSLIEKKKKDMK